MENCSNATNDCTDMNKWYNTILAHLGQRHSRMTIQTRHHSPDMRRSIHEFYCNHCQQTKIPCTDQVYLPECNLTNTPWYEVSNNLTETLSAKTEHFNGEIYTLTCIETTTNIVQFVCIDSKISDDLVQKFKETRFA